MTTHLARYFQKTRLQKGLKLSEVALRLGYRRTNRSLSPRLQQAAQGSRRPATSTANCSRS